MRFTRRSLLVAGVSAAIMPAARAAPSDEATGNGFPLVENEDGTTLTIRDDLGARLQVSSGMARMAVLNRYTAEFVRAIAGSQALVGVGADTARDKDYWPSLHASLIGQGQFNPNYEAIISLKPDAVLFPRNSDWDKARQVLRPFAVPVIVLTAWDVLKHEENVALLGRLLDRESQAAKLNAFYRHYRDLLAQRTAGVARKRVYFEEVGNYKTVLKGSGWHDMIEAAGGINVFGDVNGFDQPVSRGSIQNFDIDPEEILARRPDVIVKLQPNQYAPHTRAFSSEMLRSIAARPGFSALPAVQQGQIYHISYYLAGGCSKIIGALQLATWLHPDLFADVDPGAAMRIWLEDFQDVPYPGHYWTSIAQVRP